MTERLKEILMVMEDTLVEVVHERIDCFIVDAKETDEYMEIKDKIYSLLCSADNVTKTKLLAMEELKTELENVVNKEVYYNVTSDFIEILKLIYMYK